MSVPIFIADAFAEKPFAGNPAAVCLLEKARDEAWMQSVATEMNLSETAFLVPRPSDGTGDGFDLRWFTPVAEVELCGHATLASSHVLWETERLRADEVARFHTKSGVLTARRDGASIAMDFPALAHKVIEAPAGLADALGARPVAVASSRHDLLAELADEATVRRLAPDFAAIRKVDARGVIVTARGSGGFDFVSRCFYPSFGIDEDPVTGSAHCALAPYWMDKVGKAAMTGFQASRRGGVVKVRVDGNRVTLAGRGVTTLRGMLAV